MSVTYDPRLATDLDWVRFNIGDKDITRPFLQDEEIAAILAEEPNKWLAAARCGRMILSRGNGGIASKSVDGLSISYDRSPSGAYGQHLDKLWRYGCELLYPKPRPFQVF